MPRAIRLRCALALAALVALDASARAAQEGPTEEVPYVRTPQAVVDAMLRLAAPRPADFLVDLGSGDGRIVITAAQRYGTRGLGVDLDATLVAEARARAVAAGVAERVRFEKRDLFATDLAPATIVTMYLLPEYNLLLRPKLLAALRPGARIVSHDWDMGEWRPDARLTVAAPDKPVGIAKESTVYLWIVPARVSGRWRTEVPRDGRTVPVEIAFTQAFQDLGGEARIDGRAVAIERASVAGARVLFRFEDGGKGWRFDGRARGDRIVGQVSEDGGPPRPWRAFRVE
ncbi:MAG: class I SAM-dependent methyltransferase [Burkholderiales bacterium]|nr:class I SAM-dependent methyltransferase [Burkholderiales bacterium]